MRSRSPFVTGLFHPLNLLTLGVAVFAGLVSAWWLFPVGVLFWFVMVVAVSRDPSLRINHEMQSRDPLAQRFQHYFDRIERSQVGVFNSLASAPARTRRTLQPVRAEIDALTMQAYALCQRMTALENYRVVSQSQSDLEADLRQLEARIETTDDPLVKREYQDSRRSLQERVAKLQAVSTQLDRVEAQLVSLSNELDGVVTQVIRLQAMGPQDAARYVPELVEKLGQEATQLKEFEREAMRI
jgi:chromosome segregation ATPase